MTSSTESDPIAHGPTRAPLRPSDVLAGPRFLQLELAVTEPEVVIELRRHEGAARAEFAQRALRIGVLALRQASGVIDSDAVKREGERIIEQIREVLAGRSTQVSEQLEQLFARYLSDDGALATRFDAVLASGGEMDTLLRSSLGSEGSLLAATLTKNVGEQSPLMKLLSPSEKGGLLDAIEKSVRAVLEAQNRNIVQQFSLDQKDSALSRLVGEVKNSNGKLKLDLGESLERLVKEFSLDQDGSALARLRKELLGAFQPLADSNAAFQAEVRRTLETMQVRREESARTPVHGHQFEDAVGALLRRESEKLGDLVESSGKSPSSSGRKVGDYVWTLGPESAAPGARIVIEAKSRKNVSEKSALAESIAARENRKAAFGIFIFDQKHAPEMNVPIRRVGPDVLVAWNAEDPATDLLLVAALSIARCLAISEQTASGENQAQLEELGRLVEQLGKHAAVLEGMIKAAKSVKKNGGEIMKDAEEMHESLARQVAALGSQVQHLRLTPA